MERLAWLPAGVFLELLALCQCLPGPSSTQLSFALGTTQQGVTGGLVSGETSRFRSRVIETAMFVEVDDDDAICPQMALTSPERRALPSAPADVHEHAAAVLPEFRPSMRWRLQAFCSSTPGR